jgi:FkbM family methyltransferase
VRYYGLKELDRKIEPFVDFDGGTFFEAGANNGLKQSNTAHFEFDRGWRGVLVEPIPQRFAEAVRNRPASACFHAALVPPDHEGEEVRLTYCNLMTVTHHHDLTLDPARHVELGRQFLKGEETFEFSAPARTISSILDEAGLGLVHLMSIDLEGFEHLALKGLDHRRHRVERICVEARDIDKVMASLGELFAVEARLTGKDYLLARREAGA